MANFKFETKAEKQRLQERAQLLKPKANNIVATELGWSQSRPNGTLELLVSFRGLDELLGDIDVEVTDETPVEVRISLEDIHEEAPVTEAAPEAAAETATETETPAVEDEEAEPVVVIAKKGGRPKKVAD